MNEIQGVVNSYLNLPSRIAEAKRKLNNVSAMYYASHSFTGSGFRPQDAITQRAITPEVGAFHIIEQEERYARLLARLERRYKLFRDTFTDEELERLKEGIFCEIVSPIVRTAYDAIQEIEYYIVSHALAKLDSEMVTHHQPIDFKELEALEDEIASLFS